MLTQRGYRNTDFENHGKSSLAIKVSDTIKAPVSRVWSVLIDPAQWWNDMTLEAKEGGLFEEQWNGDVTSGKVLSYKPAEILQLSWKDTNWPRYTRVTFSLSAKDKRTTKVNLAHEGWEIFQGEDRVRRMSDHTRGWRMHLEHLKQACEKNTKA